MTQPPLGTNQGPGPFDEGRPGQPDAPTSGFPAADRAVRRRSDQYARRHPRIRCIAPTTTTVPGDNDGDTSSGTAVEGRHGQG